MLLISSRLSLLKTELFVFTTELEVFYFFEICFVYHSAGVCGKFLLFDFGDG